MQKYLAQVEAVAPNHLDKTRSLVRAFLAGPAPKLQQRLIERRQKLENWVSLYVYVCITFITCASNWIAIIASLNNCARKIIRRVDGIRRGV